MTCSEGCGSELHTATATYISDGLYEATLSPVPTIAGIYSMDIRLENEYTRRTGVSTSISGSPFTVTIYPGEIDPA